MIIIVVPMSWTVRGSSRIFFMDCGWQRTGIFNDSRTLNISVYRCRGLSNQEAVEFAYSTRRERDRFIESSHRGRNLLEGRASPCVYVEDRGGVIKHCSEKCRHSPDDLQWWVTWVREAGCEEGSRVQKRQRQHQRARYSNYLLLHCVRPKADRVVINIHYHHLAIHYVVYCRGVNG